ncbi:ribose-phosphate pyrophosphokinase-like domain-containing protein [bacterium]|nr:ribose-phosphate pyrophosphokinase-like domain-containing protein [bacterium]
MDSTRHCINFPSSDPKSLIQIQTFLNGEFSIVLDPQLTKTTIDLVIKYTDSTTLFLLQLLADALRRQHCNVHTLYVPYMPYMRQDRTTTNNHALSAKVVAQILD